MALEQMDMEGAAAGAQKHFKGPAWMLETATKVAPNKQSRDVGMNVGFAVLYAAIHICLECLCNPLRLKTLKTNTGLPCIVLNNLIGTEPCRQCTGEWAFPFRPSPCLSVGFASC